jgi:hypothetical protein
MNLHGKIQQATEILELVEKLCNRRGIHHDFAGLRYDLEELEDEVFDEIPAQECLERRCPMLEKMTNAYEIGDRTEQGEQYECRCEQASRCPVIQGLFYKEIER